MAVWRELFCNCFANAMIPRLASARNVSRPRHGQAPPFWNRRGPLRTKRAGQAILEYVLLFGVVAAAIIGMQVFAKRGIQATLKAAADEMSPFPGNAEKAQIEGMRQDSGEAIAGRGVQRRVKPGDVIARDSAVTSTERSDIRVGATLGGGAFTDYGVGATTTTTGSSSATVVSEMDDE